MNSNAEQQANPEIAAEHLRLVLPLLNRHGIAPTPANYAVWYGYVTGSSPELKDEIDRLIADGTAFTAQVNERLHARYIEGCELADKEQVRSRIAGILSDLLEGLTELGAETSRYDQHLAQQLDEVKRCGGLQHLEGLLSVLAEETKGMRRSTQNLRADFERKSLDIQNLQRELERVRKTASSDPLTGLPNRRALLEGLSDLEGNCGPSRHSLLMLDIDNFKGFNDQHGHLTGDRVLRFVADVIRKNTKGQDTPARYGGEEFAVLLPDTPLAGALAVAENIRHHLASARLVRSGSQQPLGRITISVGAASCRRGEDTMELIERADQALYLAKERGRNRVIPETEL